MLPFDVLLFFIFCASTTTHYVLYHSDFQHTLSPAYDCLYAYLIDEGQETGGRYIRNYHLVPYCRRPESGEKLLWNFNDKSLNVVQTISFTELRAQNITSEQLLAWYAPIDLAEIYEMDQEHRGVFNKCASPWFGLICQYKFPHNQLLTFSDIVMSSFILPKTTARNLSDGTCYRFLNNCLGDSWPMCLDWREICDGKDDCINGEDEQFCDQLEITKCSDTEYRCHYGGQCIPKAFAKDSRLSIDCLDGSDEREYFIKYTSLFNMHCYSSQTFQCQERTSRYPLSFSCGNGQYLYSYSMPSLFSVCSNRRDIEMSRKVLTSFDHILDINCRAAFYCAMYNNRTYNSGPVQPADMAAVEPIVDEVWNKSCEPLSQHCPMPWILMPQRPVMFGIFQFLYFTNRSTSEFEKTATPDLICFNEQKCIRLLLTITPVNLIQGLVCCRTSDIVYEAEYLNFHRLISSLFGISQRCQMTGVENSCNKSSHFYCNESFKCVPYHRVGDGRMDCFHGEDESDNTCHLNDSSRFTCRSNPSKCLSAVALGNDFYDCPDGEDELFVYTNDLVKLLPFPVLCNRYYDYTVSPDDLETDETNCELWPCNNPYTRCDNVWHCPNGIDELNCPDSKCELDEHPCQDPLSGLSYCLPFNSLFDTYLDQCNESFVTRQVYFYNETKNISNTYLSWRLHKCITAKDICRTSPCASITKMQTDPCLSECTINRWIFAARTYQFSDNNFLCQFGLMSSPYRRNYFMKTSRFGYFPQLTTKYTIPVVVKYTKERQINQSIDTSLNAYCHRGIIVLHGANESKLCLCPPNYFGDRCQWQSQRVSLTLQFSWRSTSSVAIIFQAVIMLMDDNRLIAPNHEQITYVPTRDCNTKFNIYLLYPDRPKNRSMNYSIRVDLFDKLNLKYWSSWHLPISFSFLPVNRISTQLIIPDMSSTMKCSLSCGKHGICMKYVNNRSLSFCHCHSGYSGSRCEVSHGCNCANDSYCRTSSVCICPLHKFGSHCYLKRSICQLSNNPCQNHGLCIPTDDRIDLKGYTCFCSDDYSGERCENVNNRIMLNLLDHKLKQAPFIFIHFVTAFADAEHQRITLLKKIPFNQHILKIYMSKPFNILFVQIPSKSYYLAALRETYIPSEYIYTEIDAHQRCASVETLSNRTLMYSEYLYRTKYYPLLCRQHLDVMCFYDNDLMCICDLDRFSNCFFFNHTTNYDCEGNNNCENGGQCFQNNETCPTKSTCVCQDCYYGAKCQFSTKGFLFYLDPILGYHVKPFTSIFHQPLIIKITVIISTIIFLLGLVNGLLSILIFQRKKPREVGSGYYLLISSISSLFMIIILTIKFWQLIWSQMAWLSNRSLLYFNCITLDFILKILLASNEWLHACVAFERMTSVIRGVHFNKNKSKQIVKSVVVSIFFMVTITQIHDPIHRKLIDDDGGDEERIWCFVQYSVSARVYNSFITLFHFLVPFGINVISALVIVKKLARQRSSIYPERPFHTHLQRQFQLHKHLMFAPCMLILLSLPRLFISFSTRCMKSAHKPWVHLIGYFASFIPSTLTLLVFVFPSKTYKNELKIIYIHLIQRLNRSL